VAVVVVVEEEPAGDRPPPPLGNWGGAGAGNLCLDLGTVCCTAPIFDRPLDTVPGNILVAENAAQSMKQNLSQTQ